MHLAAGPAPGQRRRAPTKETGDPTTTLLAMPHAPRSKETGNNVKVQAVFPATLNLSRINDQAAYPFEFLRALSEITVGGQAGHLKPRCTPLA